MTAGTRGSAVALVLGLFMAVIVAKIGNPVIFRHMEVAPTNTAELIFSTWPTYWAYPLLIVTFFVGAFAVKLHPPQLKWIIALPIAWLLWVALSVNSSVAPELSRLTIKHFLAAVICFFFGCFVLAQLADTRWFWRMVILGFAWVLWLGLDQQYGGLEATRKMFMEQPNWNDYPPEFKLKMQSNRIFSSFVYPNAFAGAILLWAPALVVALWQWTARAPSIVQKVSTALFAIASAACLFWSGSKAGWLIAVAMTVAALLHLPMQRMAKIGVAVSVLVIGLSGFLIKYRDYLNRGATSASARLIYWQAAVKIANDKPLLGAGPGTFQKTFAAIKPPEAEMARLTHNDYLEQACDSGWPAFILFLSFVSCAVTFAHRAVSISPLHLAAWLGVFGWSLQSFVEFGLYIPAIAWSAFLLLGWLLATPVPQNNGLVSAD